jgi:excisionase family DNA binding protein
MVVKQLYRVEEVASILSMGRSTIFDLIRSGRLASVKEGAMRRITEDAIRDYVRKLTEEGGRSEIRMAWVLLSSGPMVGIKLLSTS